MPDRISYSDEPRTHTMSHEELITYLKSFVTQYLADHIYGGLDTRHAEHFAVPNYRVTITVDVYPDSE